MSYSGVQPQYGTFPSDLFTGNGSNTVFTMSSVPGNDAALLVTVDGVRQHTDTYSYSANTLTFSEAPGSGAIIETVNMGSRADIIITEGVYKKTQFTATASQTNFNILTGYTVGFVDVYLNGIRLVVADDFTANDGSTIILATAAASGDSVEVVAYGTFNVANALMKSGDTMSGNLVVSGTTTINGTLTATANVNIDSGTLFVDGTNNRVGINNTAPTSALTVTGAAYVQVTNTTSYTTSTRVGSGLTIYNSSNTNSYAGIELLSEPTAGNAGICGIAGLSTGSGDSALVFGTRGSSTYAERMRIDSSGRVTVPYQPSFYVSDTNSSTTIQNEIIFTTTTGSGRHNTGSYYSTSTGRFTAPVTGYYQMSYTIRANNTSGYLHPSFRINNATQAFTRTIWGGTLDYKALTYTAVFYLTTGDYVSVSTGDSQGGLGGVLEVTQCSFSGRLLG